MQFVGNLADRLDVSPRSFLPSIGHLILKTFMSPQHDQVPPVMKVICVSLLIPNSYGRYCVASSSSVQTLPRTLHIQRPHRKYLDVRRAYLAYVKLRKRKKSQTRMIVTKSLLQLWKSYKPAGAASFILQERAMLSSDYRAFLVAQTVLEQEFICRQKSVQPYREYRPCTSPPLSETRKPIR